MEIEILHGLQSWHNDVLDQIMLFITSLGDGGVLWITTSVLLLAVPRIGKESSEHMNVRRIMGISMLLSLLLNFICGNLIIKNIYLFQLMI